MEMMLGIVMDDVWVHEMETTSDLPLEIEIELTWDFPMGIQTEML